MSSLTTRNFITTAIALVGAVLAISNAFGQQDFPSRAALEAARAQYQEKLQQVFKDKPGYAAAIVRRWEASARESGKWDENYESDLRGALVKLMPDNLIEAGDATSYESMMHVLATGRPSASGVPYALGDTVRDLVYTSVTPCRIVDTRFATAGAIIGTTTRQFDADGSTFSSQGGANSSCGIPSGVAGAVTMTITVTQPVAAGYVNAWGLGAQPASSVVNYSGGQTIANTSIIPIVSGGGNDFSVYSLVDTHVVIDVLGYFASPVATALDCSHESSALTSIPVNAWTAVDAVCPTGRTATGGGHYSGDGTLGYPGVWTLSLPGAGYGFNGWRIFVDNQSGSARILQAWGNLLPGTRTIMREQEARRQDPPFSAGEGLES
jgi:hypothetical protein